MKNIIILGAALLGIALFVSCSEDALTPADPQEMYEVPQGNATYDTEIVNFFNSHGTRIIYKFEPSVLNWNFTSYHSYIISAPDESYISESLDLINECFDVWKDHPDFLELLYPYYIALSSEISVVATQSWISPNTIYLDSAHGLSYVAFGHTSSGLDGLTKEEKLRIIGDMNKSLIAHAAAKGFIEVPTEFRALSPGLNESNDTAPSSWGYNGAGYLEPRYYNSPMNPELDMALYVKYLISMTEEDFKAWALSDSFDSGGYYQNVEPWAFIRTYPIKQKYEILIKYFKNELGIDLHAIGNALAGN